MAHDLATFTVPALITSPADVSRLRRELKALDDWLHQQQLRSPGEPMSKLPKTSRLLDELTMSNKLNLLDGAIRTELIGFLSDVAVHAPVVTISFASDPSSAFMAKIVEWLRANVHPSILVRVGLQPQIAAGCVIRTYNKLFDFSLRASLDRHKHLLLEALNMSPQPEPPVSPQPVAEPVVGAAQ